MAPNVGENLLALITMSILGILLTVTFIDAVYLWLIPTAFDDYKSYWPMVTGVMVCMTYSGCKFYCYAHRMRCQRSRTVVAIIYATAMGVLAAVGSLVILINTVGE